MNYEDLSQDLLLFLFNNDEQKLNVYFFFNTFLLFVFN